MNKRHTSYEIVYSGYLCVVFMCVWEQCTVHTCLYLYMNFVLHVLLQLGFSLSRFLEKNKKNQITHRVRVSELAYLLVCVIESATFFFVVVVAGN